MYREITSDFDIVGRDEAENITFLIDLDLGGRSVTNDAENVFDYCRAIYVGTRVVYRDSMKQWCEIVRETNGSVGWQPFPAIKVVFGGL